MLSVIIATRSRANNLRKVLTALNNQSLPRTEYEIIVSDDNSTDDTQSIINEFKGSGRFKYVFNNHKPHTWNASIPRNLGALIADPETTLYVFIDSDVVVPHHHLQTVLDDHNQNPNRVIIGPYHWMNQSGTNYQQQDVRWPKFDSVQPEEVFNKVTDGLACFGGNLSIPKDIFWKVGGFDTDVHIGLEDGSMGLKLWKIQAGFSYDKRLLGEHQWHETPTDRFPSDMSEHIKALNMKHYHEPNPDYGIVEASRETYKEWGIEGWNPPPEWRQNQLNLTLKINRK